VNDDTDQPMTPATDPAPSKDGTRDARGRFGAGNGFGLGRAEGARAKALLELDAIGAERAGDLVRKLMDRALEGDTSAADILLKRVWIPTRARAIKVDLPKIETAADARAALSCIVEAVAAGDLDLDSAKTFSEILEKRASSLEMQELQERIEALEARANGGA
jgi:hypothetical protein